MRSKNTLFNIFSRRKNTLFKRNSQIKAKKNQKKTKNPIQISKLYNLNSQIRDKKVQTNRFLHIRGEKGIFFIFSFMNNLCTPTHGSPERAKDLSCLQHSFC